MIVEKNLKKLFQQLDHDDVAQISLGGNDIFIRVFDDASKISLATPVYYGGNFIPKSVRESLSKKLKNNSIKTAFSIDESQFQIHLTYLGKLDHLNNFSFTELLEEFTELAHNWREYLDENDRNDLVYVKAP